MNTPYVLIPMDTRYMTYGPFVNYIEAEWFAAAKGLIATHRAVALTDPKDF